MPRRKTPTEGEAHKPLISFERIVYEKTAFKLSRGVLTNIEQYVAYIKDVAGEEPTPDEIVDKGMQRLFDADRGFKQWLQRNNSTNGHEQRFEAETSSVKSASAESLLA